MTASEAYTIVDRRQNGCPNAGIHDIHRSERGGFVVMFTKGAKDCLKKDVTVQSGCMKQ